MTMKGLMQYDFQVLISRRNWLILIGALSICYILVGMGCMLMPMFLMVILTKISVTKIEEPTGKFLFTLPFTKKSCAYELYAYPFLGGLLTAVVMFAISCITAPSDWMLYLVQSLISLAGGLMIASVMIPILVKFGTQAAGLFLGIVLAAVIVMLIYFVGDMDLSQILLYLEKPWAVWFLAALMILLVVISRALTLMAINEKTY